MKNINCPACGQQFKADRPYKELFLGSEIRLNWECPYCYTPLYIVQPTPVKLPDDADVAKLSSGVRNKGGVI